MKKIYALCFLFLAMACKKDDSEVLPKSSEKDILSFVITVADKPYTAKISGTTITTELPEDTDVTALIPTITLSKGATINPNTGVAQNFSKEVSYTVTAEDKSTKTYKVMVTVEKTEQPQVPIEIEPIPQEATKGKAGGEIISFNTNTLPVKKEQIKVKLVNRNDRTIIYSLKVQKIDKKERRIDVALPATYKNGEYRLEATFDKEEVTSGTFVLDSSIPALRVLDINLFEGPVTVLATTSLQKFNALIYAKEESLAKYTYYLRKNGQDYPLVVTSASSYNVHFLMFDTPSTPLNGGKDFDFVIKGRGKEYVLPFVNSEKERIEVVVAHAPVIRTLSSTTLKTGDELTVTGENFTYMSVGRTNGDYRHCSLLLMKDGAVKATLETYNHRGTTATFTIDDSVPSGTYKVVFSSQIRLKSDPFSQEITIEKKTTAPTSRLKVREAVLYDKNASWLARQVFVTFTEEIKDAQVKALVFPQLRIENLLYYPIAVSSSALQGNDYEYLANHLPEGYVLIEENGREYQVTFSLKKKN